MSFAILSKQYTYSVNTVQTPSFTVYPQNYIFQPSLPLDILTVDVNGLLTIPIRIGGQIVQTSVPYDTSSTPVSTTLQLTNIGNASIGDKLVVMFEKTSTNNHLSVTFPNTMYITRCGTHSVQINIDGLHDTRVFTFDGEVFVDTHDNC